MSKKEDKKRDSFLSLVNEVDALSENESDISELTDKKSKSDEEFVDKDKLVA
jgi:hypothetical protein